MSEDKFIRVYQNIDALSRINSHVMGELLRTEAWLNLGEVQNIKAGEHLKEAWEALREGLVQMSDAQAELRGDDWEE